MLYNEREQTKRLSIVLAIILLAIAVLAGLTVQQDQNKLPVRILILPKFEVGEIEGVFPGEAQHFYEKYLAGGTVYDIAESPDTNKLYYKDGVALSLFGQGKLSAALNTSAILADDRFDFSDAYILSVGCGGSAEGYGILGDVYVISSMVDFDLGHRADPREMDTETETTWFHDESFDENTVIHLDQNLTERVFECVKNH